jgi:hypothetical protein
MAELLRKLTRTDETAPVVNYEIVVPSAPKKFQVPPMKLMRNFTVDTDANKNPPPRERPAL